MGKLKQASDREQLNETASEVFENVNSLIEAAGGTVAMAALINSSQTSVTAALCLQKVLSSSVQRYPYYPYSITHL